MKYGLFLLSKTTFINYSEKLKIKYSSRLYPELDPTFEKNMNIMKRLLLFAFIALSLAQVSAHADFGNRYKNGRYANKGNISSSQLPKSITKYLNKNYPDHVIMVSKLKGNGYYYVKIRYNNDGQRPYYRSLVFDNNGSVVKG